MENQDHVLRFLKEKIEKVDRDKKEEMKENEKIEDILNKDEKAEKKVNEDEKTEERVDKDEKKEEAVRILGSNLFKSYTSWCNISKIDLEDRLTKPEQFYKKMRELNYTVKQIGGNKTYILGCKYMSEDDDRQVIKKGVDTKRILDKKI